MKVFSKQHRNNRSTPLLETNSRSNALPLTGKPKGISKVTSYKNKLTHISQQQSVKTTHEQKPAHYPKTDRNQYPCPNSTRSGYYLASPSPQTIVNSFCTANIPLIKSVQYNSCKSDVSRRYQEEDSKDSQDLVESSLCYGKFLDKQNRFDRSNGSKDSSVLKPLEISRNITNFVLKGSHSTNDKEISCSIKKLYAVGNSSSLLMKDKENIISNTKIYNKDEDTKKKINHYKNSKIRSHTLLPSPQQPQQHSTPTTPKQWNLSCFHMGRKLGRGRFGSVHMAEQKQTGLIFALKIIDLLQVKQQQMQGQIIQEMKLQLYMNHPNILKMYGYFRDENSLYMVLEYANEKCLFAKLHQKLQEKSVAYYTRQMLEALKYCHGESILHRDLKPENILLCEGVAKLADFGWAAYAPRYKRNTFCGTLDYVPPEIIKGRYYDQKVDIWSLGVLIYEMTTGRAPFETESIDPTHIESKTMNRILDGDLIVPLTFSLQLRKLIFSILMTQPEKRPTLKEIEESTWLKGYKESAEQDICSEIWRAWTVMVSI